MRVSWSWLQDFIDLSDLTPKEVARRLTDAGTEVEGIEDLAAPLAGVVVARILDRQPHPSADRLGVCTVDDGTGTPLQIVCGAPNAAAGLTVPLARLGASVPAGNRIVEAEIRGVRSFGMLCSARELGLSTDHGGLMVLSDNLAPGTPFAAAIERQDVVLDVSLTPNRSDCLSMLGLARELSAILGRPLRKSAPAPASPRAATSGGIQVRIDAPDRCALYAAAAVDGVVVGDTPAWMVRRLEAVGQRSINPVVDITNYVLFELGQPLHAFDRDKLQGETLIVGLAEGQEPFSGLDAQSRTLAADDLTIRDAGGPVALAGVLGGLGSGVTATTTRIVFEAARFSPSGVRRTARRQGLRTESSYRFERSVDPDMTLAALQRALDLLQQVCGPVSSLAPAPTWAVAEGEAVPFASISMPNDLPSRVLGVEVSVEESTRWLRGLGLTVEAGQGTLEVQVPRFRPDLTRPIDLVEEIGRLRGYADLPGTLPSGELGLRHTRRTDAPPVVQPWQPIEAIGLRRDLRRVRETSVQQGLFEAVNWAMASPDDLARLGLPAGLVLSNPLSHELSAMRTTLLAGLLHNVRANQALGNPAAALFEVGSVFHDVDASAGAPEPLSWAAVQWGEADGTWHGGGRGFDGWDLRGVVDAIASVLRRPVRVVREEAPAWAHPGEYAAVWCGQVRLGWVGQLHPDVVEGFDIAGDVFASEIDLTLWQAQPMEAIAARAPVRRSPSVRDAALAVDRSVAWSALESTLLASRPALLESWSVFDVYEGDKLPAHLRGLGVRFVYRSSEAVTEEQISAAHASVLDALFTGHGATLRT